MCFLTLIMYQLWEHPGWRMECNDQVWEFHTLWLSQPDWVKIYKQPWAYKDKWPSGNQGRPVSLVLSSVPASPSSFLAIWGQEVKYITKHCLNKKPNLTMRYGLRKLGLWTKETKWRREGDHQPFHLFLFLFFCQGFDFIRRLCKVCMTSPGSMGLSTKQLSWC